MPDLAIVGDGDFAHLAELFEAIVSATGAERAMGLELRRVVSTDIALERRSRAPGDIGSFRHAGDDGSYAIVEATGRRLVHVTDPDPLMMEHVELARGRARVWCRTPSSFLRHASALAIRCVEEDDMKSRWRGAELLLDRLPQEGRLEVELTTAVAGRYFRFALHNADARIGSLLVARIRISDGP